MMLRVTLNGIKRRGLTNWKAREAWLPRKVRIWSAEHSAWWRAESSGYTAKENDAGLYDFPDAWERTKHCGPEKRISFHAA